MSEHSSTGLPRQLGVWSAAAIVVGLTIGSGIFRTPATIATRLPGPLPLVATWIVAGLIALCGALTLAELSSRYPRTGGLYVYIRNAFGRLPAFLFGWAELTIIGGAAAAAIATTFAEYTLRVLGMDPTVPPYNGYVGSLAAVAIIVISIVNCLGIKWSSLVQNVTTAAKCLGLLFIIVAAFVVGGIEGGGHFTPVAPEGSFSIAAFGLAMVSVLWAYDGWAELAYVSGEVKDPEKTLPRAFILGTLTVITLYVLANLAYLSVLSVQEISASRLVAADVAFRLVGQSGVAFVAIVVMISTLGALNGSILTNPRVLFAMAADGLLFRQLSRVHPRLRTPHVAILVNAALGVGFVLLQTFEQLADTFITAILPFYALGVGSIFILRRREDVTTSFRTPLYPVTPGLFVLASLYLLTNALLDETSRWPTLAVFGVIVAGVPVYYLTVAKLQQLETE